MDANYIGVSLAKELKNGCPNSADVLFENWLLPKRDSARISTVYFESLTKPVSDVTLLEFLCGSLGYAWDGSSEQIVAKRVNVGGPGEGVLLTRKSDLREVGSVFLARYDGTRFLICGCAN